VDFFDLTFFGTKSRLKNKRRGISKICSDKIKVNSPSMSWYNIFLRELKLQKVAKKRKIKKPWPYNYIGKNAKNAPFFIPLYYQN